jgi:hypothetical protein
MSGEARRPVRTEMDYVRMEKGYEKEIPSTK